MKKKAYINPEMEIVEFETEDVITTSIINDNPEDYKDPFETPEL